MKLLEKRAGKCHMFGGQAMGRWNGEEMRSEIVLYLTVFLALSDPVIGGDGWWSNTLSP